MARCAGCLWCSDIFACTSGPPSPPWAAEQAHTLRRRVLAQVLVVDHSKRILLARHTAQGLLPGQITGLIVETKQGEAIRTAALRAAREVAGLDLGSEEVLELKAVLDFYELDQPECFFEEHEFVVRTEQVKKLHALDVDAALALQETGTEVAKHGMVPEFEAPVWYDLEQIPYGQMPADDRLWYPAVLGGATNRLLQGRFLNDGPILMQHEMWWQ
mmetsp:Transcript_81877/g.162614  ORF Transcript_81877/g.162614 Transcript_81877/m.162614 type:complete len:216 (-) Transcript_81877:5-652(-)